MSKTTLLPCPFCGEEAHMSASSDGYGVQCWNRRCIDMQMEEIPTEAEAHGAKVRERIVRCRDCKQARPEPPSNKRSRKDYQGGYWCDLLSETIGWLCEPDGYCAWGVRRET